MGMEKVDEVWTSRETRTSTQQTVEEPLDVKDEVPLEPFSCFEKLMSKYHFPKRLV